MIRLLISTGEVSGDLQGSLLIRALYREAQRRNLLLELLAIGGHRMRNAGAELLADTTSMGAIGFWEPLFLILPTLRLQRRVGAVLKQKPPDGIVLIDYMGANIRLGRKLKRLLPQVPIIYYIAPQEWAWRFGRGRTTHLLSFTNRIIAIFPEEAAFYAREGAKVTWVGHPLLDIGSREAPDRNSSRQYLGLAASEQQLLLLPASRPQELRYLMPVLVQAAAELQRRNPSLHVLVPASLPSFDKFLRRALSNAKVRGRVIAASQVDELKPYLIAVADLALGKSGTVNLELALQGVPQVVGYRVSKITAFIARYILRFRVEHISPVNLLLRERLVPELLQSKFTSEALVEQAVPLLEDEDKRQHMLDGYMRLKKLLGVPGVTDRAAATILNQIVSPLE